MFSIIWLSFGLLACLSLTEARYCGYDNNGQFCYPDDYEESYCCGYNNAVCCYYTDVAALWWFWFIMILVILFFVIMIVVICRRRRQRLGYVVVGGQTYLPGSVITRNDAQITQAAPSGTVYPPYYGGPPYQGYQDPNLGGQNVYGYPPPYAPPTAPPNAPEK